MVSSSFTQHTLLGLNLAGGYIAFSQIVHPQNHYIMTLPFYQNVKLGPTSTFYYQSPSHIRIFWFHRKQKTRQDKTEFFLRTKSKNKYQVGTNYQIITSWNLKSSAGVGNRTKTFYIPVKK